MGQKSPDTALFHSKESGTAARLWPAGRTWRDVLGTNEFMARALERQATPAPRNVTSSGLHQQLRFLHRAAGGSWVAVLSASSL